MKKILGISLVAVLAVTPLMAHATDVTIIENVTGSALTTQAYVKGAYNELGGHINTKADKTALAEEASTRADADAAINEAIADLQTSASNLGSGKVNSADNFTAGTDSELIKNKTVENAIKDTAAQVDTNTAAIETKAAQADLNTLAGRVTTAEGDINTLEASVATKAAQDDLTALAGRVTTAESDIDALETADTGLSSRITTLENVNSTLSGTYATKTGVDNAIEKAAYTTTLTASTVTGTVSVPTSASISVVSSWTDDTPADASVTLTNQDIALANGTVKTSTITTTADANYTTANQL